MGLMHAATNDRSKPGGRIAQKLPVTELARVISIYGENDTGKVARALGIGVQALQRLCEGNSVSERTVHQVLTHIDAAEKLFRPPPRLCPPITPAVNRVQQETARNLAQELHDEIGRELPPLARTRMQHLLARLIRAHEDKLAALQPTLMTKSQTPTRGKIANGTPSNPGLGKSEFGTWARERGLSAADLAAYLGLSRSLAYDIVKEKRRPSLEVAVKIDALSQSKFPPAYWLRIPAGENKNHNSRQSTQTNGAAQ